MIQIPRLPQRTFTYLLLLGLLLSLAACGSPAPSSALTVYVSLFEGDAGSRSIAAFDAQTGQERWHYDSKVSLGSLFFTAGALYAGGGDQRLYAISTRDGSLLWAHQMVGIPSVAAAADGVLYVNASGIVQAQGGTSPDTVYALNAKDGSLKWRSQVQGSVVASSDDTLYVGTTDHLYALRASDGSVRWQLQLEGSVVSASLQDGLLAVFAQGQDTQYAGVFSMLNAEDGAVQWRYPDTQPKPFLTLLAQGNETVYLAAPDAPQNQTNETVSAFNMRDGSLRWSKQMEQPTMGTEANGVFYVGGATGILSALNAADGSQHWQAASEDGAPRALEGVQVDGGLVYVTRDRAGVSVLNSSDGSLAWHYQVDNHADGFVTVAGLQAGMVCFSSVFVAKSSIEVVRAADGGSLWQHDFSAGDFPEVLIG